MTQPSFQNVQLCSTISAAGRLELSLIESRLNEPGDDEIVVAIEAAPVNPSDIGLMIGYGDITSLRAEGTAVAPVAVMDVAPQLLPLVAARLDIALPTGNEGAGLVVQAGANVQHLLGKRIAAFAGGMYARYRILRARDCLVLPDGASSADGAAAFVNPLTALGMVETMRRERHEALVHTAAASNLGQMLNRVCLADGIALVNIVRSEAQADVLRAAGARHVLNSTAPGFDDALKQAVRETGATLAFDAIGGGRLAGTILGAMEAAQAERGGAYSVYGSPVRKQVYVYGALDAGPIEVQRKFGMAWNMGGWLLPSFLEEIGHEAAARLQDRVRDELRTTFASQFQTVISLKDALCTDAIRNFAERATGQKTLIDPRLDCTDA